jgi:hypothetical protein
MDFTGQEVSEATGEKFETEEDLEAYRKAEAKMTPEAFADWCEFVFSGIVV